VYGDVEPFKAPDGTVITGRRKMREYMKHNNLTHVSDYNTPGGFWDKKRAEREKQFTPGAGFDKERRRERIAHSIDQLRRNSRGR